MEVNKKQLADIFGASIRTIQNWQEQGMPVLRGGGKGNEVLYDSAAVIKWYAERDAEIENEKLRREVEELRQASETDLQPGTIEYERHRLTRAQADAQELKNARARSAWGNCDWIGSGRMAIDGLKEVQEAVMLIEAGLSTYEKECAKRGDDYQEIFAQQVRETMERRAAGLKPPAWAAAVFESGLRQSTEEEKSDSRAA